MSKFEFVHGRAVVTRRPVVPSKFDDMTKGEIREHAAAGHPEAMAILRLCERMERKLARTLRERDRARRERRRRIAAENQAARGREERMVTLAAAGVSLTAVSVVAAVAGSFA